MNKPAVQICLQRLNGLVEAFPQGGLEELLFDRAVEAFDEAIGLQMPDLGAPLLDRVEREIELEGVALGATVLTPIVGQPLLDREASLLAEGQRVIARPPRIQEPSTCGGC